MVLVTKSRCRAATHHSILGCFWQVSDGFHRQKADIRPACFRLFSGSPVENARARGRETSGGEGGIRNLATDVSPSRFGKRIVLAAPTRLKGLTVETGTTAKDSGPLIRGVIGQRPAWPISTPLVIPTPEPTRGRRDLLFPGSPLNPRKTRIIPAQNQQCGSCCCCPPNHRRVTPRDTSPDQASRWVFAALTESPDLQFFPAGFCHER
jgi:hypothetical protein